MGRLLLLDILFELVLLPIIGIIVVIVLPLRYVITQNGAIIFITFNISMLFENIEKLCLQKSYDNKNKTGAR